MLMQMTLGKFTYEVVRKAFEVHTVNSSVMPTPADIVKIIEPPAEPRKWCGATFIDIKRRWREGQFITDAEKRYCDDFVAAKVKAPDEVKGLIEDSIREVKKQNRLYWSDE